jgi:hypothetical protein
MEVVDQAAQDVAAAVVQNQNGILLLAVAVIECS